MGAPAIGLSMAGNKVIYISTYDNDGKILMFEISESSLQMSEFYVGIKIKKGVAIHDINGDGASDFVYGTDDNTLEIVIDEEVTIYEIGCKIPPSCNNDPNGSK